MAQPTRYARAYSFTGYQTADPSDPLPAQRVDAEFDAVALTTDETRLNLALVQRDDGKLRNASVHPDALDSSTLLLLGRSEEHTSELQSLMRISYAVFCLKKKTHKNTYTTPNIIHCTYNEPS